MFFYALLDLEGDVETRAWKAMVLTTSRGLADVLIYQKTRLDRYYKVFLSLENFGKRVRKVIFVLL